MEFYLVFRLPSEKFTKNEALKDLYNFIVYSWLSIVDTTGSWISGLVWPLGNVVMLLFVNQSALEVFHWSVRYLCQNCTFHLYKDSQCAYQEWLLLETRGKGYFPSTLILWVHPSSVLSWHLVFEGTKGLSVLGAASAELNWQGSFGVLSLSLY